MGAAYAVLLVAVLFASPTGSTTVVEEGTTLADLGVDSPITLTDLNPSFTIGDLDIDASFTDPDAERVLGFKLDSVVRMTRTGTYGQFEESKLSVGVNDRTAIQIRMVTLEEQIVWGSNGWIDGGAGGELGEVTEVSYSNYLQFESAVPTEDDLTFKLFVGSNTGHEVEVDILPTSGFIVDEEPGASTLIEVVGSEIEKQGGVDVLRVDYSFSSDRATSANISVDGVAGLEVDEIEGAGPIEHVPGVPTLGTVTVPISDGAVYVEGLLVAATAFNDPAVPFSASLDSRSSSVSWAFVVGPIALSIALVAGYSLLQRRGSRKGSVS